MNLSKQKNAQVRNYLSRDRFFRQMGIAAPYHRTGVNAHAILTKTAEAA